MKVHISQESPWRPRCVAFVLLLAGPLAATACTRHELVAPARGAVLQERQPTLRWEGPAHEKYRVQVTALLPEARVVAAHDLEVAGTTFRLPAALPVERAALKVLVSRGCPALDAQDVNALGAWFFIDVRDTCVVQARSASYRDGTLSWPPTPGAESYKVRIFHGTMVAGAAATPGDEVLVPSTMFKVPAAGPATGTYSVATIQPVCQGLPGRTAAVRLRAD